MSLINNNFLRINLVELKFDMLKEPIPNDKDSFSMGIKKQIKKVKEIDSEERVYITNVIQTLFLGDDIDELRKEINNELKEVLLNKSSYIYVNFEVVFKLQDLKKEGDFTDEISDELLVLLEPYFKELVSNIFSRSSFPTPPIPHNYWRNDHEFE
ncbi:hypothetical protein [Lactococcus lactis]|uniref:hypothetical protein n=1 Tax=Lactococcus lactis TaxID=1358 RepID=UPI00288E01A3|nr:hypothetical protein [Lactococcus lactis]MDT2898611.1 hypothetical protein [Lactococcus lactis]MDT2949071.1 hypothetical protein [Lactococcus lactis]